MKKSIASGAKRGSVGTLILEALSTSDKYGWEIMKAIEEKSNGEFILKEPSLYSSLKRMEVSGLITSYWQDSDIGGRRHYYNITEKGLQKLNESNIVWIGEKEFIGELFLDNETTSKKPKTSVDSSIYELNKTVGEVQKTIHKLTENSDNIKEFLKETEEDNLVKKATPTAGVVETIVKAGDKIILPSINPLQQDIFSVLNTQNEVKPTIITKIEQPVQVEKIEKQQDEIVLVEKEKTAQQSLFEGDDNKNTPLKPSSPTFKKEKYTATPSTYVQMPLFEEEKPVTLSGIYIEEEKPAKKEVEKPTIQHIRSLATEREFLEVKNAYKNKTKSFLNKINDYKPTFEHLITEKEPTPTLTKLFDETKRQSFNNLGLEETLKAKQELEKEEDSVQISSTAKLPQTTVAPTLTSVTKENTFTSFIESKPTKNDLEDEIDYKSIMGELFTEDEKHEVKQVEVMEETSSYKINELPRINVSDNINVSLKLKKKEQKVEEQPVYNTSYTYTYTSVTEAPKNNVSIAPPVLEEPKEILKPKKELKNFHESLSGDEYSNGLLEDIYFNGLKVRTHKIEAKTSLVHTSYVSINKLHFNLSFAIFVLMLIQIIGTYVALTNAGYITTKDSANLLFIVAGALSFVPVISFGLVYLFSPLKKKEVNYNLLSKIGNNIVLLLIALVFIYAVNLFAGLNTLNIPDFMASLILPGVLSFNLVLLPIIKFILLKRKKYYL